jgi:hypothetical protein
MGHVEVRVSFHGQQDKNSPNELGLVEQQKQCGCERKSLSFPHGFDKSEAVERLSCVSVVGSY